MNNQSSQIDAREVFKKLQTKTADFVLLDVRTPHEYQTVGRIAGSINLPLNDVQSKVQNIIPNKEETIYVYCLSGSRSSIAVQQLKSLGYKNVYDMISGLLAWRVYKLPLEV